MLERLGSTENLLSRKFDLIMVMGSPLELANGDHYYPPYNPGNPNSSANLDGDMKAQAIEQIYLNSMTQHVIVTGGMQNGISRAEALVRHTNLQYVVPLEFMTPLTSRPHSIGNLESMINYLEKNPHQLAESLGVLTIEGHILRVEDIINLLDFRQFLPRKLELLSAEQILLEAGKLTLDQIRHYYATDGMQQRALDEEEGRRALRAGNYTPRS